ncbi:CapA family protein [Phyllobacterium endophyticum]|uniref:Capsule biosynthesis protein CapA n=1 Tax=Phyllobacterium endophyticum TaxID=1149773 RepID=A0A2P7AS92_9HYPH|nr:CapA family protein [Phyllobacterium endophyticum]MBB3236832.1 poly-gamma-glutamate synthesis protein (capsule biosynthesis protein) [Phyllobacterium endophyticum]PSH57096.1 capsule biosynthesis protein CapA [Phyllobacterium endophyticum]TYR40375.1 CapA family protein [Phyllobacterium endophyticum]
MKNDFVLAVAGQSLIKRDTRQASAPAFEEVKRLIKTADLAFTNFESTVIGSHGGWPLKGSFFGSSKPEMLDALTDIGFRALSLSNNHAFDLGPSGVLSTLDEATRRGFLHAGIGRNVTDAAKPGIGEIDGRSVAFVAMDGGPGPDFMYAADAGDSRPERPGVNRIKISQILDVDTEAFQQLSIIRDRIGYTAVDLANDTQPNDTPTVDPQTEIGIAGAIFRRSDRFGKTVRIDERDFARNLEAISAAANAGRLVVAYLHHHHWASDWLQVPDWVGAFARKCIDAGASMFVSHGAPVLQPIEIYSERPIFYSLGNFIFHTRSEVATWRRREVWESVVGLCAFSSDNRLTGMKLYPVLIGGEEALEDPVVERRLVPHLAVGASADRILQRLAAQSEKLGSRIEITDGVGILRTS